MNCRILRLAIPNIISNITVPLLGMFDMALMGHLCHTGCHTDDDGPAASARIGITATLFQKRDKSRI